MLEELLTAIQELTATLKAMSAAAPAIPESDDGPDDAPPAEEKPKRTRKAKAVADEPEVTLDDVRAALKVLVDAGRNDDVKALLKKYKAAKLSDVAEDKYATLKADAEAAAAEGEGEDDLL